MDKNINPNNTTGNTNWEIIHTRSIKITIAPIIRNITCQFFKSSFDVWLKLLELSVLVLSLSHTNPVCCILLNSLLDAIVFSETSLLALSIRVVNDLLEDNATKISSADTPCLMHSTIFKQISLTSELIRFNSFKRISHISQ